jgi:hypothetical protein
VMEKCTLKQSPKWFVLSDAERAVFFEMEMQRNNVVVPGQRQAIEAMLKRKQGETMCGCFRNLDRFENRRRRRE